MKPVDSKMADRVCIVCDKQYRPTSYTQKACKDCTPIFRINKMPDWKSHFKSTRPEYNKEYQREYYKRFPESYIYWGVKRRSRLKNIPFNIELSDIAFPEKCPILGIPLKRNTGKNNHAPNSPSVDRIIPELGYTKGNIQIISMKANIMKSNATIEELQRFADWVLKTFPR